MEKCGTARQSIDDNMMHGIGYWIAMATNKHSEYVILIAFTRQHWLQEHNPMFCYTYSAYLVKD
jgi:hypothetical protein